MPTIRFLDPVEIDRLVAHYLSNSCDYSCNHQDRLGSNYSDGFGAEILSNSLLQRIADIATDPLHREHVTSYIFDNPHEFTFSVLTSPKDLAYPNLRFDVDTRQDLAYLKLLIHYGITIESSASDIVSTALATAQGLSQLPFLTR